MKLLQGKAGSTATPRRPRSELEQTWLAGRVSAGVGSSAPF